MFWCTRSVYWFSLACYGCIVWAFWKRVNTWVDVHTLKDGLFMYVEEKDTLGRMEWKYWNVPCCWGVSRNSSQIGEKVMSQLPLDCLSCIWLGNLRTDEYQRRGDNIWVFRLHYGRFSAVIYISRHGSNAYVIIVMDNECLWLGETSPTT